MPAGKFLVPHLAAPPSRTGKWVSLGAEALAWAALLAVLQRKGFPHLDGDIN
jgi:hypothetical protein